MSSRSCSVLDPEFRGRFHLSAPEGWLNDPNGFSWFSGEVHLFYQHHPFDSAWGPMHWGHAVSTDLVHWTLRPVALTPNEPYDAQGCFSGGAVEDGGRHALLYTGHVDPDPQNPSRRFETQCLAWGDGTTYDKAEENPVIGADLLPPGASLADFRDPKVWKEGTSWYCLVANRHSDGHGQALLFTATDPRHWRLVGPALQSKGDLGGMWECPDFFVLDGREVLLWSVMGQPRGDGGFQNPHAVVWACGTLDRTNGAFTPGPIVEVDFGPDFYAAQTLMHPDGRVLLVAWMQMWERSLPTHDQGHGWAGQMTLLREVFWHHGKLAQRPVRELEAYRGPLVSCETVLDGAHRFPGIEGQHLDLEVGFRALSAGTVGVKVFQGEDEETVLTWEPATGWLTLDRSRGGLAIRSKSASHPETNVFRALIETPEEGLRLRIVLDRSSLEVFVQGGTTTMTATVYPKRTSTGVEFFASGGRFALTCRSWQLVS